MKTKVLFVFGTRPEAIKLAPVIKIFQENRDKFITEICITSQHKTMLRQVLKLFDLQPDYDLELMKKNQTLEYLTAKAIEKLGAVYKKAPRILFLFKGILLPLWQHHWQLFTNE